MAEADRPVDRPAEPLVERQVGWPAERLAARLADQLRQAAGRPLPPDRAAQVRSALQELADLAATAQRRQRRTVPRLADHALADQLLVLWHDCAIEGAGDPAAEVLRRLS